MVEQNILSESLRENVSSHTWIAFDHESLSHGDKTESLPKKNAGCRRACHLLFHDIHATDKLIFPAKIENLSLPFSSI